MYLKSDIGDLSKKKQIEHFLQFDCFWQNVWHWIWISYVSEKMMSKLSTDFNGKLFHYSIILWVIISPSRLNILLHSSISFISAGKKIWCCPFSRKENNNNNNRCNNNSVLSTWGRWVKSNGEFKQNTRSNPLGCNRNAN